MKQYDPLHLIYQIDHEFPHNDKHQGMSHGMDVNDIPEAWFVAKGLSNGRLTEDTDIENV
jgi:hypothetical protein